MLPESDLDQIREELEKQFGTRISPRDPIMMDLAAKRIESSIHLKKVEEMLKAQQTEASAGTLQLLEEFRRHFDTWINEGGNFLEQRIDQAGDKLEAKLSTILKDQYQQQYNAEPNVPYAPLPVLALIAGFVLFMVGFAVGRFT